MGKVTDVAFARRAASLFLSESTYDRGLDKSVCREDLAIGFRFEEAGERIGFLVTFPCDRVLFLTRSCGDLLLRPGEYFDPATGAMSDLVREAFPSDPAVCDLLRR